MERIVLDHIPFRIELEALAEKLRVPEGSDFAAQLKSLAGQATALARPKAVYRVSYVESRGEDFVVVGGHKLTSRVLRVNLENVYRVFPFVATCGTELGEWADSFDDLLLRYWAETINEMALRAAVQSLARHISGHFRPGPVSTMNPGSLADWPMEQQRALFNLLGDVQNSVGVRLTDSFLMIPIKSISGVKFPTETGFENCMLCPREKCSGRRAPYDRALHEKKYGKAPGADSR